MKRQRLAALDVGSSKICCITADTDGTDLRILGVGVSQSAGIMKGQVTNQDAAKSAIKKAVKMAEQAAGYRINRALVNVTGRNVVSYNNRGVVAVNNHKQVITEDDVDRVLEVVKQTDNNDEENTLLHLIPLQYAVDKQEGVKNPIGMHGFRLDVDAHIINASYSDIENLTKSVNGAGINVNQLIFNPLASAEAVLSEDEKQSGVIMADIGASITDVAIYKDGYIIRTAAIPVGGASVTHDIAVGLNVPEDFAEMLKCRYVGVGPEDETRFEEVINENGYAIPYKDLYEITKLRLDELMRLIMLELPEELFSGMRAGIVLTGGATNMPGIENLAANITRLPVRIGTPPEIVGVSDDLYQPCYATAVGQLLWDLTRYEG
ncbi:MAG: cell division protein FtsA [Dehalococcoidales bacterium]|nr:cell division protein FtsA [Dehalococcoidales bacterium]